MKTLLYITLFLIAAAIGLLWMGGHDSGYVLINQFGYNVEISVVMAIGILILLFLVVYWLFRWLGMLRRAPKNLKKANKTRAIAKAHASTSAGYASLIEGNWNKAEKQLMNNIDHNPSPMLNYLAAANAAQQRDDIDSRDNYIRQALEAEPKQRLSIGLTKARLQYQAGQLDESMTTLKKVQKFAPKNSRVLRLLTEVGRESGDWETVLGALPAAKRAKALTVDELEELEVEANRQVLALPAAAPGEEAAEVDRRFESLKAQRRKDPRILERYARRLIDNGSHDKAEQVLRTGIKRTWDGDLVYLYGLARTSKPEAALKTAEGWTKNHGEDPDLLLTLGRLAMQNKIWGKARSYLEASIASGGRNEAHRELGRLLEQLGETSAALGTYKDGLERLIAPEDDPDALDSAVAAVEEELENPPVVGGELVDRTDKT